MDNEISRRRTFAIIAHPDAGKTSLTEKLLLFGGQIQVAGAVKSNKIKKTATSDWMDIEKQRGISVTCDEDVLLVLLVGCRYIAFAHEEPAQHNDCEYYSHNTQRIGQGTAQRRLAAVYAHLLKCLLRRSKSRRVCSCTAQYSRHVGHGNAERVAQSYGRQCTYGKQTQRRCYELCAFGTHRAEETGTHLQAQRIHEQHQTESLGIEEHVAVDGETGMTGQDADKEDKCYPKRDAAYTYLAQHHTQSRYQRQHHNGLQCRVLNKKRIQIIHSYLQQHIQRKTTLYSFR